MWIEDKQREPLEKVLDLSRPAEGKQHLVKVQSISYFSEVTLPQSTGLSKPPPGPQNLDKDFTKSIELAHNSFNSCNVSIMHSTPSSPSAQPASIFILPSKT